MSSTVQVSSRGAGFGTAASRRRTEWALWIAAIVVLAITSLTLAITLTGSDSPAKSLVPGSTAVERYHADTYAPSVSSGEVAERQGALQRMKQDAAADTTSYEAAFKQMKEEAAVSQPSSGDADQEAFKRLKEGF